MTEKKSSESQQSSTSALEANPNNKNYPLVERKEIKGTPFTCVKMTAEGSDETQWFGIYGEVLITPIVKTEDEVLKMILDKDWQIIFNVAGLMAEFIVDKLLEETDNGLLKKRNLRGTKYTINTKAQ